MLEWVIYIIAIILGTELFAYFWHRYGAHADYIPGIHETHRIHHTIDLSEGHKADEDFIWILFLIILVEFIVGMAIIIRVMPGNVGLIAVVISVLVFGWNWWIHRAYHDPHHWLNEYSWFQQEKTRHYLHHYQPHYNYGIASHFMDQLMGTWIEPPLYYEVAQDSVLEQTIDDLNNYLLL